MSVYHNFLLLDWLLDLLFVAHLVASTRTGFYVDDEKEMRRTVVRSTYLRSTRGLMDMLACVPLDLLQGATGWNPAWRLNKLLRVGCLRAHMARLQAPTPDPNPTSPPRLRAASLRPVRHAESAARPA